jgi:acetylornithine deacetylase/succinyl-diaminopimelate desuccinylase-like protein
VATELRALGLAVELIPFSFRGRTYHNVLGTLPARDARRPRLLLGAHFDSTADTPGADDYEFMTMVTEATAGAVDRLVDGA